MWAADRDNVSALLPRSARMDVPGLTRRVRITMTAARQDGLYDDGYADTLALLLSAPGPTVTPLVFIPGIMGSKLDNTRTHVAIWETGMRARDVGSILQLRDIAAPDIIPTDILDPYAPLRAWLTGDGGYREYPSDFTEAPLARFVVYFLYEYTAFHTNHLL